MVLFENKGALHVLHKRISALNVYRGIAVLLVMFNHVHIMDAADITNAFIIILRVIFDFLFTGGWIGVDLFLY